MSFVEAVREMRINIIKLLDFIGAGGAVVLVLFVMVSLVAALI